MEWGLGLGETCGVGIGCAPQISTPPFQDWNISLPSGSDRECYIKWHLAADAEKSYLAKSKATFLRHSPHAVTSPAWDNSADIQVRACVWGVFRGHCWEYVTADVSPGLHPKCCSCDRPAKLLNANLLRFCFLANSTCNNLICNWKSAALAQPSKKGSKTISKNTFFSLDLLAHGISLYFTQCSQN